MASVQLDERGIVVTCPSCGRQNRVPFTATEARCGACKSTMPAPAEPIDIATASAFDALLESSARPIVVDFWAPWCGPCHMVAPEMARVAASNAGRWLVVKVNTDALPDLGERYRIRSIPTMAVFRNGREIARTSGARPASDIEAFVRGATT
jgi:thioredoxin 2